MNFLSCIFLAWFSNSFVYTAGDLKSDIIMSETKQNLSIHHRKKRYLIFPEGSTASIAVELSPPLLEAGQIFTNGISFALSYDLPNETVHSNENQYEFPLIIRRRKRSLFTRLEKLMNSAGIDGNNCILHTICETVDKVAPRKGIIEEIFRLVFTYPLENVKKSEWGRSRSYGEAHKAGEINGNCHILYPCPFSLLELALQFASQLSPQL